MKTKYVIVDGSVKVFSSALTHSDQVPYGKKADAAGFVSFFVNKENEVDCQVYGDSFSIGIGNRGQRDENLIRSQILREY